MYAEQPSASSKDFNGVVSKFRPFLVKEQVLRKSFQKNMLKKEILDLKKEKKSEFWHE